MRDIEGGPVVIIFERYEMSMYVCEYDYWVLLIGLLKLVK